MQFTRKYLITIILALFLTACGSSSVKTVQSLSDTNLGNLNIDQIKVSVDEEILAKMQRILTKEQNRLVDRQEYVERLENRRRVTRESKQEAKESVVKQQQVIADLERNLANIIPDIENSIRNNLNARGKGVANADLVIFIDNLSIGGVASMMLAGGTDTMKGTVTINDSSSDQILGIYNVTGYKVHVVGGIAGTMARADDPQWLLVQNFSDAVVGMLYNEK